MRYESNPVCVNCGDELECDDKMSCCSSCYEEVYCECGDMLSSKDADFCSACGIDSAEYAMEDR